MGVSPAYWASLSLWQPKPKLLFAATYGRRYFIVFMLNCGSTSKTMSYCVSFHPGRSALNWFFNPCFDRFPRQGSLTSSTMLLFKTLRTLNPCFSIPDFNAAWIFSVGHIGISTLHKIIFWLFNLPCRGHSRFFTLLIQNMDITRQIILFIWFSYHFSFLSTLLRPILQSSVCWCNGVWNHTQSIDPQTLPALIAGP